MAHIRTKLTASKKQKAFYRKHGWTLTLHGEHPHWTVPKSDGIEIRPATQEEMLKYSAFKYGTWDSIMSEVNWLKVWWKHKIDSYQVFKAKVTADARSKREQNRSYWVLMFQDGKYRAVNRYEIKYYKKIGLLGKAVNHIDIDSFAVYCTKRSILKK